MAGPWTRVSTENSLRAGSMRRGCSGRGAGAGSPCRWRSRTPMTGMGPRGPGSEARTSRCSWPWTISSALARARHFAGRLAGRAGRAGRRGGCRRGGGGGRCGTCPGRRGGRGRLRRRRAGADRWCRRRRARARGAVEMPTSATSPRTWTTGYWRGRSSHLESRGRAAGGRRRGGVGRGGGGAPVGFEVRGEVLLELLGDARGPRVDVVVAGDEAHADGDDAMPVDLGALRARTRARATGW